MSDIFNLFGFKWYLLFIPRHGHFQLYCDYIYVLLIYRNISDIVLYYKLIINAIDAAKSYTIRVNTNEMRFELLDDETKVQQLKDLDNFTLHLEMILFTVYDINGNNITDKYMNMMTENEEGEEKEQEEKKDEILNEVRHEWILDQVMESKMESPFFSLELPQHACSLEYKIQLMITMKCQFRDDYFC